jgi:hypothetical protein
MSLVAKLLKSLRLDRRLFSVNPPLHSDWDLREYVVKPLYMDVLHANFLCRDTEKFTAKTKALLPRITQQHIAMLLDQQGWREAITASWFIALKRDASFIPQLRERLLPSQQVYAGQFHLVALARIGTDEACTVITDYLDTYLPVNDKVYDQLWAIGTLNHVTADKSSLEKYMNEGLWQIKINGEVKGSLSPQDGVKHVEEVMEFIARHFD